MNELMLRFLAVLSTAVLLIVFGVYFTVGTDTLQHDYIFFGGGALSLLSGLATLPLAGLAFKHWREFGDQGIASDVGYPELAGPPPNTGGAAARAAAAAADSEDSSDDE
ncbi:MAG: hypothetical protein QOE92_1154 [Chloroflexota bacterium]|jgi:hypothetical protein|nr:hypothetical protein [Chloroflexota bacterium]